MLGIVCVVLKKGRHLGNLSVALFSLLVCLLNFYMVEAVNPVK